jgi:hypothetical protein
MSQSRTAAQAKLDYERVMGSELGAVYNELWQQLAWLHGKWDEYAELFGTNQSRVELLNEAAPRFFRTVQDTLWDDVLIHIARLLDPPKSAGRDNLSFLRLAPLVDAAIKPEVDSRITIALSACAFARDWRNRRIAHGDFRLAMQTPGVAPLTPTSRQMVREGLESLCAVINAVGLHYLDTTNFFDAAGSNGGALQLLHVIDAGLTAKRERHQRVMSGQLEMSELQPRKL